MQKLSSVTVHLDDSWEMTYRVLNLSNRWTNFSVGITAPHTLLTFEGEPPCEPWSELGRVLVNHAYSTWTCNHIGISKSCWSKCRWSLGVDNQLSIWIWGKFQVSEYVQFIPLDYPVGLSDYPFSYVGALVTSATSPAMQDPDNIQLRMWSPFVLCVLCNGGEHQLIGSMVHWVSKERLDAAGTAGYQM